MQRRTFIKILGSSAVVAAATSYGSFALTRTPQKALQPWEEAGDFHNDIRKNVLSYAILAPNPHNRQPWQIELGKEGEMTLYCDPEKKLPQTDPFDRQILIGLGCFLEILKMAAAEKGYRLTTNLFPEGEPLDRLGSQPVAHLRLDKDSTIQPDPLFASVTKRRSNKEPYLPKSIPAPHMERIESLGNRETRVYTSSDQDFVNTIMKLTWDGHLKEVYTPRTLEESVELMRIGKREIEANPDGIDLGGSFFELLKILGMMTKDSIADPNSSAFKQGLEHYRELFFATPAYTWIVTNGNSRYDQIKTGMVYVRSNLKATQLGLSMHPISQCLQEYAEMQELYSKLHTSLNVEFPYRIQMLARLGYGIANDPSPRWKVEKILI